MELEPDPRPRQVVAVERRGQLNGLAKPDGAGGIVRADGRILPAALVEIHGFAMRQIALVHLPRASGQLRQAHQPFHHGAGLRREQRKAPVHLAAALRRGRRGHEHRSKTKNEEHKNTARKSQRSVHGRSTLCRIVGHRAAPGSGHRIAPSRHANIAAARVYFRGIDPAGSSTVSA